MRNWSLVLSTGSPHEAELVKGLLENHGISAVVMDEGSSAYPHLGEKRIYVDQDELVRAKHLVSKHRDQ